MSSRQESLLELTRQDILQYIKFSSDFSGTEVSALKQLSSFLTPSLMCCFLFRLSHWFYTHRLGMLARLVSVFNTLVHKADICPASVAGGGLYIPHTVGIVFHGQAGKNLTLYGRSFVGSEAGESKRREWPVLGDNIIVGAYSLVLGNVTIGDDSIIGPQCVAKNSVLARTTLLNSDKIVMHQRHTG